MEPDRSRKMKDIAEFEMKNGIVIKSLLIAATITTVSLGSSVALATMKLTTRCEDNFVGQVQSVQDSQAPLSALAKVQVEFRIEESNDDSALKDSKLKTITVLKDGPHKYQIGQKYSVGLNNGFVCHMERLKS